MKFLHILTIAAQLIFLKLGVAQGQDQPDIYDSRNRYLLLLDQFNLYKSYFQVTTGENNLIKEAAKLAGDEDFEIAIIYLEEALASLKSDSAEEPEIDIVRSVSPAENTVEFRALSGIDFNRQEFEVGFLESDSTVLEEVSKPYFSLQGIYTLQNDDISRFEISNALRYDKENWRDDYYLRWSPHRDLRFEYRGFWNESKGLETNSFWEHDLDLRFDSGGSGFRWMVQNNYVYKNYRGANEFITDYYRNRLNGRLEWTFTGGSVFSLEGISEKNESLGREDYDYWQHNIRTGLRKTAYQGFGYAVRAEGGLRNYSIQFEDSIVVNAYKQLGSEIFLEIPLKTYLKLEIDDNFLYKVYREKSTLEPDYFWNLARLSVAFIFSDNLEIAPGYEYELKHHKTIKTEPYDVSEQNYDAGGFFLSFNYFSQAGTYISMTVSYLQRRYPQGATNDLISIYSDRNIFTAMLLAYIPLSQNLRLNAFATYDNDDDIDLDQQSNQSIIYNLEIEYKF